MNNSLNKENITYERILKAIENYKNEDEKIFLDGLESRDEYIIWHSIKGCGLKKVNQAIPKLINIISSPCNDLGTTNLRRITAWTLAKLGYDSYASYLQGMEKNENVLLREAFADAIGITNDPRGLPFLDLLMNDSDDSVLLWASLSLSKFGDTGLPIIEKHLFNTKNERKAIYMLDALKKIDSFDSRKLIIKYFEETKFNKLKKYRSNFLGCEFK